MDMDTTNGVWLDTANNKVVDSQPEEGVQLIAPGGELTEDAQATVARYQETVTVNVEEVEGAEPTTSAPAAPAPPVAAPVSLPDLPPPPVDVPPAPPVDAPAPPVAPPAGA